MPPRPGIGTLAWSSNRQHTALSRAELGVLGAQLVRAQLTQGVERVLLSCGIGRGRLARLDLDRIPLPDSAPARAAVALAEAHYRPPLLHHCYRTYYWAMLMGQHQGKKPDPELLFVVSILHDLGLAAPHDAESRHTDFAVVGAGAAHRFAIDHGLDERTAGRIADAIGLHLNPVVAGRHGVEAQLLAQGAQVDFVGLGAHRLRQDLVAIVHERHPRTGGIAALFPEGLTHPPGSRPATLGRSFARLGAKNPLNHW